MLGPTYFFVNGKSVRRKRSGAIIVPALPKPPATATVTPQRTEPQRTEPQRTEPQRTEPQRAQPKRTEPELPPSAVATVASLDTVANQVAQPRSAAAPEPARPARTETDRWETVLTALREDQAQRGQEWRLLQQEHQNRMHEMQQQMKVEVEAALRRVLES